MNLNRILINESEKKRILGLHSEKKSLDVISEGFNPADQVYTLDYQQSVQATIDFGTVFPKTIAKGTKIYRTDSYDKLYLGNTGFVMYCDRDLFIYNTSINDLRIGAGDVRNNSLRKILGDIYCNGKKIKNWSELAKDNSKKDSPTNPIKNPINEPKKELNCKNKNPYNALTDAGLNWKQERQKWIDANCNGTTPCILGNAQTNINLRNAFCDGTWGSKKEQDVLNPACSSKCSEQPKVVPPGSIVTQQIGYFYDSTQGKCVGVTGQNGPFGSIAECEACKCGSQSTIGDRDQKPGDEGQKPGDGNNKLPDFIPPTIVKEKNPSD